MAAVVPFEIDEGTVQDEPDGEQFVKVEFRLTVLPVEFVRLNVILSCACTAVAKPSAAKSAAATKNLFFIANSIFFILTNHIITRPQLKVAIFAH